MNSARPSPNKRRTGDTKNKISAAYSSKHGILIWFHVIKRQSWSVSCDRFVDQEMRLPIHFDGRNDLQRTLKQFKIITKIEVK